MSSFKEGGGGWVVVMGEVGGRLSAVGSEPRLSSVACPLWCLVSHRTWCCSTGDPYGSGASESRSC